MLPAYNTYVCETDGVVCDRCKAPIPKGAEFAVVTTPSEPSRVNCLDCTDGRISAGEKHLTIDSQSGKAATGRSRQD